MDRDRGQTEARDQLVMGSDVDRKMVLLAGFDSVVLRGQRMGPATGQGRGVASVRCREMVQARAMGQVTVLVLAPGLAPLRPRPDPV